jgi:probable HAF family extracellular repeat protein
MRQPNMNPRALMFVTLMTLFVALVAPIQLGAQHTHYKFIDIPTLGGPAAIGQVDGTGISQFVNNWGVVVGGADTSISDPTAPGCADCFLIHAFRWQDGVLSDLGALSGVNFSHATSVNARGWATGGSFTAAIDPLTGGQTEHAVLWKDGEIIDLGTLPAGIESAGLYVKNSGEVVGFSTVDTKPDPFASIGLGPFPSATHAFIWKNGVIRDLGTLGGPDAFATAGGCNLQRDGLVAGASFTSSTPNPSGFPTLDPFLWKDGTMIDLGSLGGTFGVAQCANNRGQVIGQSNLAGGVDQHAFLWQDGNLADLRTLGGSFSVAFWLNNAGEAVGGADTTGDESFHATLWRNGQITDLGTLDDDCASRALAINSKNQIIGQSFNCDTNTLRAVLWEKESVIDLNAAIPPNSSLQLVEPFNINDRGEIVGRGLPAGCDDGDVCGHIFLLIPCNDVEGQSCQDNAAISGLRDSASLSTSATPRARPYTTKNIVAQWRARLGQRYNMRTLARPQK